MFSTVLMILTTVMDFLMVLMNLKCFEGFGGLYFSDVFDELDLLASYGDFDGLDVFQDLTIQIFTCFDFCAAFARCECFSDG